MSAPELKIVPMDGNIPELVKNRARARRVENSWREHSFISALDEINGVTVNQLTLEHMLILFKLRSPFVTGGKREPEHVAQFLWIISPQHHSEMGWENDRTQYVTALIAQYPPEKFRLFYRAIDRFIWVKSLMDLPGGKGAGRSVSASWVAMICHRIAVTYGTDQMGFKFKWIMESPIAMILQMLNCIAASETNAPAFHPLQDAITQRYIRTHLNNG
jgi:hypothetical protein